MKRHLDAVDVRHCTKLEQSALKVTESSDEDEPVYKLKSRLGKCEVCAAKDACYCCPKCDVKTCCLACVQIHKKELSCDGIRDRTKFIPLRNMTKMDFMSDYYFLEETTRFVENCKHDRFKHVTRYNKTLPTHLYRLRNAAAQRKTTLRFLLHNFVKRKENTTYFDWKLRKLFWHVEWHFVNCCGAKYVDNLCDEDVPLHVLLDKYLNPESVEEVPLRKTLEHYQSAGAFKIQILLKAEGIKRCRSRFYSLNAAKTLKENLHGKTVVEFPCIYLCYEKKLDGFNVIDSDEDIEKETKSYQATLNELVQKERQKQRESETKVSTPDEQGTHEDAEISADMIKLQKLLANKQREELRQKRENFESNPNNFLFTDEQVWDILSTSNDESETGNETDEEQTNTTS